MLLIFISVQVLGESEMDALKARMEEKFTANSSKVLHYSVCSVLSSIVFTEGISLLLFSVYPPAAVLCLLMCWICVDEPKL